jgi:hypothetical protein
MLPEYPAELIKVDIAGADSLILITDDCGDANSDHSDWANAILYGTTGEGIEGQEVLLPSETNLVGNFPNPFNPTTTIVFELHKPADVTVNIYNMLGQKVANLVKGEYKAGRYEINWDAGLHFSSGIYFYELRAGDYMTVKKMLLLK